MSWDSFVHFALGAVVLWILGAFFAWKDKKAAVYGFTLAGIAVFFAFILAMWVTLGRPPLKTMDAMWLLLGAFICLQICWWGINYLPSAKGLSIHTYSGK